LTNDKLPLSEHYTSNMDECGIYPMGPHLNSNEQTDRQTNKHTESDNASGSIININGGPMYPNYNNEAARISSFTSWPPGLTQRPQHMAKAGLFYTGRSDQVKCFYCDGGLESWQPEDSPIGEHEKWFPDCTFVRLQKEPDHKRTQELVQKPQLKEHVQRPQQQNVERQPQEYSVQQITTESDKTELSNKAEVQKEKKRSLVEKKTTSMKVDDMKDEIEKLQNERMCKICWENEVSVVFLPCGHLSSCSTCAPAFKDCPICRRRIEQVVKTFLG